MMLNLEDLEQLVAFYRLGTLSKVAEEFHISQPSITRTMKRVEESFGVPLFLRTSNQIELNETGKKAVEYATDLLKSARNVISQVQDFHQRLCTITVESCAPAPLWSVLPMLSKKYPEKALSSSLCETEKIIVDVQEGNCTFGVMPYRVELPGIACEELMQEHLFICVPKDHALAGNESVTCEMINGFNCLLASEIGFWDGLCQKLMPSSRFLVQTDEFTFRELVKESSLPCFTTNLADDREDMLKNHIVIPITNPEVNVTYYMIHA